MEKLRTILIVCPAILFSLLFPLNTNAAPAYVLFESGQVRPLAISPDGSKLFAVNTPDNRLAIFNITKSGLELDTEVPVGLEPVAVAARTNHEVWVVNHLSDSVSIVSLLGTPRVVRTLLVGDEPRDIVFAGRHNHRAFITTAHRGQHRADPSIAHVPGAGDPQLTTPGVGRADVWVFDAKHLGETVGGTPLKIITLFGDTPRALAVSPDNETVYAAIFRSGNQTTTVLEELVCDGFMVNTPCIVNGAVMPGGLPGPRTNRFGQPAAETGLIAKFNRASGRWEDTLGRNWDNAVRFNLPDLDVFAIDARSLEQTGAYPHVGTTLFNMAVNPRSGALYVSNTEAFNNVPFSGPGFGGSTVQGHLAESRITVISEMGVRPRHLNKHINYSILANHPNFDPDTKSHSLATPTGMAVSRDGSTLYVAAFGSAKIGVFSTRALENDSFDPRTSRRHYLTVSGGGPSGVVLDEERDRLYVLTRFNNSVSVIDLRSRKERARVALYSPEPAEVIQGRPFLYDAFRSSANGEASCASCHIFGDTDHLAWNLGNPDDPIVKNPIPITFGPLAALRIPNINGTGLVDDFNPMKGPLTTLTLRGIASSGALHWRGDRSNGVFGVDAFDPNLSFLNFAEAFTNLLGLPNMPTRETMQRFADFQLKLVPPPNPNRALDNSLTVSQQRGRDFYTGPHRVDGLPPGQGPGFNCNGCHVLDPANGFFGATGRSSFGNVKQIFKIPHFRTMYQQVGMFGMPRSESFLLSEDPHRGDQIRGFGYQHNGAVDTIFSFLHFNGFIPRGPNLGLPMENTDGVRRDLEQFILAFDSDLAPIVGQQVTLTSKNAAVANPRIDLLISRARTPFVSKTLGGMVTECDLIAKAAVHRNVIEFFRGGRVKGFLYDVASDTFRPDDGTAPLTDSELRKLAKIPGQEVTYTCAPPGSGIRMAINRTLGTALDGQSVRSSPAAY